MIYNKKECKHTNFCSIPVIYTKNETSTELFTRDNYCVVIIHESWLKKTTEK